MNASKYFILFAILLTCCSKPVPHLDGIDLDVWKEDRKGCMRKRSAFEPSLRDQRDKLKGLSEMDVVELLGRPDMNVLSERNEKYYHFFLTPSPDCNLGDTTFTQLIVRFNAVGISKEATIER
jgi:hypothetical protein